MRALFFCLVAGAAAVQEHAAAALMPADLATNSSVEGGDGCPNYCSGNGECMNGVCKCYPGYTYYDCSLRAPPRPSTRGPLSSPLGRI